MKQTKKENEQLKKVLKEYGILMWLAAEDIVMFYPSTPKDPRYVCGVGILCSDSFCYACADAESIEPNEGLEVKSLYEKYGWSGVMALVAYKRDAIPLKHIQTKAYKKALINIKTRHRTNGHIIGVH